ncbi:MAG: AAA family ATPase [Candidatus Lokiarchaeota archaeon]
MLKNPDHKNFNIDKYFKDYLNGPKIFKNREALEQTYIPKELPHRDDEIEKIANLTACALRGDTPQNLLIFGMTGTGKTATIRFVSQKLAQYATHTKPWWIYINCRIVSTPYRILAHIYNTITGKEKIPPTGLPKDVIFKKLLGLLDHKVGDSVCFLVLDEIDAISEGYNDEILYDLTRINESLDYCRTCLIGISNRLNFTKDLDPRVLSSLGKESITFSVYNARELADILEERSEVAFYENVLKEGVISLCAALAAKDHGDARKALQLLRKAGEIAERTQNKIVSSECVKKAQNELEKDNIKDYVKGMPLQAQVVLLAVYLISKYAPNRVIISGDIYEIHKELSNKIPGVRNLTIRRISDYINELSLSGIISANIRSFGQYGRTKIISLAIELDLLQKIFNEIDKLRDVLNYKPILIQNNKVRVKNNIFRKLS